MQVTIDEITSLFSRIHLFKKLGRDQLEALAEKVEIFEFSKSEYIYNENSSAENLYFILTGEVAVGIETIDQPKILWVLGNDDYFGEDILSESHLRRSFARASKKTILLAIDRNVLIELLQGNPLLLPAFRLVESSYQRLIYQEPSWIKPDEATRFIARSSPTHLVIKSMLPAAWLLISAFLGIWFYFQTDISVLILFPLVAMAIIFGSAWLVWNWVDWSNDFFLVTKRRVVYLEKVLLMYESRQETPLSAILSITKQSSFLGRILGFSDIAIRTYTGVLFFKHISSADEVINLLTEQWERIKKQISNEDREEMETLLRQKIKPEDIIEQKENQEPDFTGQTIVKSGWLMNILATLFSMRKEEEAVITYRTHWFMLLKKTIFPSVSIITLFLLFSILPNLNIAVPILNPFLLILGILSMVATIWWIYQFVDWRNDFYLITKDQLVDVNRKPLGLEDRRSAPIKNIQSVEYKRIGFWGILLNFGTVFIRIGDSEFTFDLVHNPSQVQKEIFDRYNTLMTIEKKNQLDEERERMASWMEAYHHIFMEDEANN
jgi:uncharacterized membrane protein YdbT with pleckstrin-like domain